MNSRVLIIDDETEIRRNLTVGLTQEGFTCTACPDGISAIHELYSSRDQGIGYDYLISDIFMPDIDGLKILKVIKSEFPDLPVLIITGFGNEMLEATALAEKNTGFLDKPFEISELVESLKKLKPIATTLAPQSTVDLAVGEETRTKYERSDYCPVPRAVPVLEAMVAFVLADGLIDKLGGDSISEIMPRFQALKQVRMEDVQMENQPIKWWD